MEQKSLESSNPASFRVRVLKVNFDLCSFRPQCCIANANPALVATPRNLQQRTLRATYLERNTVWRVLNIALRPVGT